MLKFVDVFAINCSLEPRNNETRLRKAMLCNYDKTKREDKDQLEINLYLMIVSFSYHLYESSSTTSAYLSTVKYVHYIKEKFE